MVGQYFDENSGPLALNDYDQQTQMYDEEDSGEAEVFYFADSKGHARTSEAKVKAMIESRCTKTPPSLPFWSNVCTLSNLYRLLSASAPT